KSMDLAIINYGMGNLLSVRNALESLGAPVRVVEDARALGDPSGIVLPGVGAFGEAMRQLEERGFADVLANEVIERKKPFLGICLGLQVLGGKGYELGEQRGLGWIRGEVTRLEVAPNVRVPHIGWSEVAGRGTLFAGIPEQTAFYFVHSYRLVAVDDAV